MAEDDIAQLDSEIAPKPLKPRYQLFVNEYVISQNASKSARAAGYNTKRPSITGYKLLQKPAIKAAIAAYQAAELEKSEEKLKTFELSKEKFTETAWKKFETVEDETIKPRYLDIAGRSLGYLGKDGASTTNNNLIINVDAKSLPAGERWDRLRQLIDGS